MSRRAALALLVALWPLAASAHPLAPALLELREVEPHRFAVLWRTSVAQVRGQTVAPVLPSSCGAIEPVSSRLDDNEALEQRWTVSCAGGLAGRAFGVHGLVRSGINVIVRVGDIEGRVWSGILDAAEPSLTVPEPRAATSVFGRYAALGVEHLLTGLDHLLFLLGLFLLVPGWRSLIATVTAFTAGHCVTLGLATLGVLPVRQGIAELVIAASVLMLGLELARAPGRGPSALWRRPWLVAGAFGLVHGLGFAGALRDIGLPRDDIPLSLLAFNLGIESAQIAIVLPLLVAAAAWRRWLAVPAVARVLPAYVVGSVAACWCIERTWALLA